MRKSYIVILILLCCIILLGMVISQLETDAITTDETVKETEVKTEIEIEVQEEPEVEEANFEVYEIPDTTGFKSFMDFRTITDSTSKQYEIQTVYAYTGDYGIRMVNDRYCIALGTYFNAEVGQCIDLVLKNDVVIPCILAEIKADEHTDSNNIITLHNGCATEFVVDSDMLLDDVKIIGDISYSDSNWGSPVVEVIVHDKNVLN